MEGNAEDEEKRYEWYRIRQLFKHFNDNMDRIFIAGSTSTIDESMSRWLGDEYNVPGVTKMKLKPEDAPPARVTRVLSTSTMFSTKFTEVTYKKGFKNCPLCKTLVLQGLKLNINASSLLTTYSAKLIFLLAQT